MHAGIDGEDRVVVEVGCRPLILRPRGREAESGERQKRGRDYGPTSANLGHFAASNSVFFVSRSSASFST